MKHIVWILVTVLLLAAGCQQPETGEETPQKADSTEVEPQVTMDQPKTLYLPKFIDIIRTMDHLDDANFAAVVPAEFANPVNTTQSYFSLGMYSADAIFALIGRQKEKLIDIAGAMKQAVKQTSDLKLEKKINDISEELQALLTEQKWEDLELKLDQYSDTMINILYGNPDPDPLTIVLMGGWMEGLNRTSQLLMNQYNLEKTTILAQKPILEMLVRDMSTLKNPVLTGSDEYKVVMEHLHRIDEIIQSSPDEQYSLEQVQEINKLSAAIRTEFFTI